MAKSRKEPGPRRRLPKSQRYAATRQRNADEAAAQLRPLPVSLRRRLGVDHFRPNHLALIDGKWYPCMKMPRERSIVMMGPEDEIVKLSFTGELRPIGG